MAAALPAIPLPDWRPTKDTVHLWAQIVGKVRLKTVPPRNHWWHVPLYVTVDGLSTGRMHRDGTTFRIDLDLPHDRLRVRTLDGREDGFALVDGLSVADFDARLHAALSSLGVDTEIVETPFGVPMTTPFPEDTEHASYDAEAVRRYWAALDFSHQVFEEFAGWSTIKTSPVHLYWHSFDLAVTRVSGRPGAATPEADPVTRQAYSHEVISFGFWAGDDNISEPAYYSYTAPEPAGLTEGALPEGAAWAPQGGMALMPYETVRTAADPRGALLEFMQAAYVAGADAAGWDRAALASPHCPHPEG
ncbi:MAG: DUF5996 family protein [Miltoncostaeaceae bacterium]